MRIHILMQQKGGVGKSFVSVMFNQYLQSMGKKVLGIDTDPLNDTFHQFQSLNVKLIKICNNNGEIESENFDQIIDLIMNNDDVSDVIIDNGSSDFIPLINYIKTTQIFEMLKDMGHEIIVHSIIAGGQALSETMLGLVALLQQFDNPDLYSVVVWLNPFNGYIDMEGFTGGSAYQMYKDSIKGIVLLPTFSDMFNRDITECMSARTLFDEYINNKEKHIMKRQRITIAKRKFFEAISSGIGEF